MSTSELESIYLDARYNCEAMRIAARRAGLREEARLLREAMALLCGEVRALLAREGRDKVSRGFPGELLGLPLGVLVEKCLESASRLPRSSRARDRILEIARVIGESV